MTKNEVIDLCLAVREMPFCQLDYVEVDGTDATLTLTHRGHQDEMQRNRPWCTSWGNEAWYDDEASEKLQDTWYEAASAARRAIREWEDAHKGKIPSWAKYW